ncbi:MAG TPA: DUF2651 family protein [Candidatus Merdicola faecigallinarum]|uniref:DUF2651 family protein n=1 Tax=Candidatus Merdicola faecigallinarum TaxID=2840862 RepID=A0A9D1M0E0_9FIRM|nr:DUF2651 family protein [Candidatus Merdicola faecigallinarum]
MNILLLLVFAIPIAIIVISIALQKLLRCPILVAGIIFSILLIIAIIISNINFVILVIIYTILSYLTALFTCVIERILRRHPQICRCEDHSEANEGNNANVVTINGTLNTANSNNNQRTGTFCGCYRRR